MPLRFLKTISIFILFTAVLFGANFLMTNLISWIGDSALPIAGIVNTGTYLILLLHCFFFVQRKTLASNSKKHKWFSVAVSAVTFRLLVGVLLDDNSQELSETIIGSEFQVKSWLNTLIMAFNSVVLAAVFEELLFRHILLKPYFDSSKYAYGLLICTFLFIIAHVNFYSIDIKYILSISMLGIFLGVLRLNLSVNHCILFHGLYNLVWFLDQYSVGFVSNILSTQFFYWGAILSLTIIFGISLKKSVIHA